jgi:tRNA threonylcarbamoyladenosine biosynthesis protein TsaE
LKLQFATEAELTAAAAAVSQSWRDQEFRTLLVGLRGPLGSGKTTWARAMLRGLGYEGRVPSPTYTLLEEYQVGTFRVVHVDLYRLNGAGEIESLGVRDELDAHGVWLLTEWPERAPSLLDRCDLVLDFTAVGETGREVGVTAASDVGRRALAAISEDNIKLTR